MMKTGIAPYLCVMTMLVTLFVPCVLGDGVVMKFESIDLVHEKDQTAIIHLNAGIQRMVLSIDVDMDARSVWLFPVPSDPEDIVLDHAKMDTVLSGNDMKGTADEELKSDKEEMIGFHIASIVPLFRLYLFGKTLTGNAGGIDDAQVHQTLDKEGIHSEIVTSGNGSGLVDYLRGKGKEIPPVLEPLIGHYTTSGYSFIVSWMNGSSTAKRPGIALSFPRTDLFYPMILTSAYGDRITPVNLIVLDHVKVTNEGLGHIWHSYYDLGRFENQFISGNPLANFLDLHNWSSIFTTILIEARASDYRTDLTFEPYRPDYQSNRDWDYYFTILINVSIIVSLFLSFIWSYIIFRGDPGMQFIFGSLGILNAMAIWMFIVGIFTASISMKITKPSRVVTYAVSFQASYLLFLYIFVEKVLFTL